MGILNHDFYNLNSVRRYPLDDSATGVSDADEAILSDILVDCHLRWPESLGRYAYISSMAVSRKLITVTFLACASPNAADQFHPLAAISLPRSGVSVDQNYPVEALTPGVGGWVVFGEAATEYSGRFSTPIQSLLLPRCARSYRDMPVPSLRKKNNASALTGLVLLKGGQDLEVVKTERVIDGRLRNAVVIRLASSDSQRNVLDLYKGPCGTRPESGNCDKPAIESINTVNPDCDGNLRIEFQGDMEVGVDENGRGLVVDFPIGLIDACTNKDRLPDAQGRQRNEFDDQCTSEYEAANPDDEDTDVVGEVPVTADIFEVTSEVLPCPDLPYTEGFGGGVADDFEVLSGDFAFVEGDASPSLVISSATASDFVYVANHVGKRNVSIWNACADSQALAKTCSASLKIISGSGRQNGALVLNYKTVDGSPAHDEYHTAELDLDTSSLRVRRWTGSSFLTVGEVSLLSVSVNADEWYILEAVITASGPTTALIQATLKDASSVDIATVTVSAPNYMDAYGRFGLGSYQSICRFGSFRLEDYP